MNGFEENEKHNIWRYGLVIFSVIGVMIFLQAILIGLAYLIEGNLDVFSYTPINLLWVSMLPFAGALVVLLLGIRFIHRIPIHRFFSGSIKISMEAFYPFGSYLVSSWGCIRCNLECISKGKLSMDF